jgi:glycosyltransferase involved in cell wall biosynthesis
MKVLYISPENTVGTLSSWRKVHESKGNECRAITYYPSPMGFEDDICLNLPLTGSTKSFLRQRQRHYQRHRGPLGEMLDLPGNPPVWTPHTKVESLFFALRDRIWRMKIEPAIRKYGLNKFDVYHFEWGLGLYRNGTFIRELAKRGKHLLATYHGQDFRNRGVMPIVDQLVKTSFTSELDLIPRHSNLNYLYLPYDVAAVSPRQMPGTPITICHATRNRLHKGSDKIIEVCQKLKQTHGVHFLLVEDQPHDVTMTAKAKSDIYIDQIADVAPGYGMNSIEAMALGVACCTSMNQAYEQFMPDHPFINAGPDTLEEQLISLIENPDRIVEAGRAARRWAEEHHSLEAAGNQLYTYYYDLGITGNG